MIHAVMIANTGTTNKSINSFMEIQPLSILFAIPTERETFSKTIQEIEDYFISLHNETYDFNGSYITLSYQSRSDASKVLVSGVDYALVSVYITISTYDNIVLANEETITVDGTQLEGLINVTYASLKTTDGFVFGLASANQKNYINGIQKQLIVDLLLRRNDALHLKLMQDERSNSDINYNIQYYNGFITRTLNFKMLNLEEYGTVGDAMKAKIVFAEGDA
jgi:hypothetical protein